MTGPVPPPLAPAAVPEPGHQPLAASSLASAQNRGPGQPIEATVVSVTREGPLIEVGGERFLVSGAPPLPKGASLSLELTGAGRQTPARLLAIAGRALEPPVMIRMQAVPLSASPRTPALGGPLPPAGVEVEARRLGPDGHPVGPPIPIRLTAGGELAPGATGHPPPGDGALSAEVLRVDPVGHLLLRAADLTLRLETAVDVPAGARLQLVLPESFAARSGQPAPTVASDPLDRVIEALLRPAATGGPGGPAGLRLPAADHALAARLLHWIDTLRASGGPSDARSGAGAGAPDPGPEAGALRSALHELAQQARAPQPGGWRVLVMPFGVEDPTPLRLYLRDLPPDQERDSRPGRERRSGARRAIFALELSELGCCQLDMLCQPRRFDLAVRTERPLAAALQHEIRDLLEAACGIAGVAGKVEFRAAELLSLPDPLAPAGCALMA